MLAQGAGTPQKGGFLENIFIKYLLTINIHDQSLYFYQNKFDINE